MRNLTEEMGHLTDEIARSHDAREAFVHDMKENVATMLADFDHAETDMAHAVGAELRSFHKAFDRAARQMDDDRQAFVQQTRDTVNGMLADFDKARNEMAAEERGRLQSFVADLEHNVGDMRHTFSNDMAGAHRAWMRHRQLFGKKAPHHEMAAEESMAASAKRPPTEARRRKKRAA